MGSHNVCLDERWQTFQSAPSSLQFCLSLRALFSTMVFFFFLFHFIKSKYIQIIRKMHYLWNAINQQLINRTLYSLSLSTSLLQSRVSISSFYTQSYLYWSRIDENFRFKYVPFANKLAQFHIPATTIIIIIIIMMIMMIMMTTTTTTTTTVKITIITNEYERFEVIRVVHLIHPYRARTWSTFYSDSFASLSISDSIWYCLVL